MKKTLCTVFLLCLFLFITACASSNGSPEHSNFDSQPANSSAYIQDLGLLSDEELIYRMTASRDLERWAFTNSVLPTSEMGIELLKDLSPEFAELMCRETAEESLKTIAPKIVEIFLLKEDPIVALQGDLLAELVVYLYPETDGSFGDASYLS